MLAFQSPFNRTPRHLEQPCYVSAVFSLVEQLAGMGYLLRRELGLTAHLHAPRHGRRPARLGTLVYQRPFKLGFQALLPENFR